MTEWWTYTLADFLLFSPRTYRRLFELYNADLWPAQSLLFGAALVPLVLRRCSSDAAARAACALFSAGWLWVAWAFFWQRYATIHWAAPAFAAAFAVQAVALFALSLGATRPTLRAVDGMRPRIGIALLVLALVAYPALGVLLGGPWQQAELAGFAPDPTALATLGLLLLLRTRGRLGLLLWPVPLAWCGIGGATLWAMHAGEALLLPGAALLALGAARASLRADGSRPCGT